MRILVLDNYDSFTYNIVHILRELGGLEISVIKNDLIKMNEVQSYDKIILSELLTCPLTLLNISVSVFIV